MGGQREDGGKEGFEGGGEEKELRERESRMICSVINGILHLTRN